MSTPSPTDRWAHDIAGTLRDGTPLRIDSELQQLFSLESEAAPFAMNPDAARVLVGFDLAAWLAQLDLASTTADDDGVLVLSSGASPIARAR
ncbi:MAG: hypothetical protein OXT09_05925 [Myxococcales bacterium]|nr:hypothetical protein [Myxococcales bacterium]